MNVLSKQLAIFLFPLLLSITTLDLVKYRGRLLMGFSIACTLTVLYLYADAIHVIWYEGISWKALFTKAFVNHNFSLPIDMHATYLSMLLLMALVFIAKKAVLESNRKYQWLLICCLFVLLAGLVQLSSKSVLIAGLIIFNTAFPWYLKDKKKRNRFLIISISTSVLLLLLILSVGVFRERYLVDLRKDIFKSGNVQKENWRRERWKASVDLIKESPIIGKGSGSEIGLLREIYFDRQMYSSYLNSMNAHNQYLSFLINSGILGLLIYLGTLGWGCWKAIKRKDLLLVSLMFLTVVLSFSEDILDVNKGIFFYAFFFSFLVLSKRKAII